MSKLSDEIEFYLKRFLKKYNLDLKKEVDAGFKSRYDFYIPTSPPIAIEVDGNYKKNAT